MQRSKFGHIADGDVSSAVSPVKRQERRSTQVQRLRKHQPKARSSNHQRNDEDSGAVFEDTDEVKQLRLELSEIQAALSREKRLKQRVKEQLEKSQKEFSTCQRDLEQVSKKLEQVSQIVAASEAHNRTDLLNQNFALDEQMLQLRHELDAAESELKTLHAVASQKHNGNLQRDIAQIRTSDDSKKLLAWKKKVIALENNVALLRADISALKSTGKMALNPTAAGGASSHDADQALEGQKRAFSGQLAKLQDEIVREARVAQENHSKNFDDVVKKNQGLNVEVAHLEQQRAAKDTDARRLLTDVDKLSKVVETARKKRDAMETERHGIVNDREIVSKEIEHLHVKVQDALVSLNQLILMSSEAPQMHEKAWTQERAGLQANLNSTQQKSKKLEQDIQVLEGKVETVKQDVAVEAALCEEEADVLKQLDKVRVALQHAVQQQAAAKCDDTTETSQKERIIQDLEGAIRTERRQIEEMKSLNDRLEKKIVAAKSLLQKHGFDA